jgi:16S rRNA C1402 N4-methylase RsmH
VASFEHESVLVAEVLEHLSPRNGGIYCVGTLGGGGHAARVLEVPGTRLVGIDRDPAALEAARARLGERAQLVHGEYGDVAAILAAAGIPRVDGFVLDLGVSSPQLDVAERGFSFTREGPLDMRMDPTRGQTALELLRATEVDDLEQGLEAAYAALKPGGRLVVISFHSLEDRIVKQFMNRHAKAPPTNRRLPELTAFVPTLDLIGGAIKADDDELAVNPRSRSAVLRVAEKRAVAG